MCDVFTPSSALSALRGKSVLLVGDSIMRNIYKDIVYLLSSDDNNNRNQAKLIPTKHMMAKGEDSYRGDTKVKGSKRGAVTYGRDYTEERDWHSKDDDYDVQVSFRFITRCHDEALERDLRNHPQRYGSFPDVILLNSALWDINRWGPRGIQGFKENLHKLMALFNQILPERTQVIWMTTPPIATDIRAGVLIQQLEFTQKSMRFNIMEANQYAATATAAYGYDVLDMHYHFINQIHRRSEDGVHWKPDAVRMQVGTIQIKDHN